MKKQLIFFMVLIVVSFLFLQGSFDLLRFEPSPRLKAKSTITERHLVTQITSLAAKSNAPASASSEVPASRKSSVYSTTGEIIRRNFFHKQDAASHRQDFRFHIYDIPQKYISEALQLLEQRWSSSPCNRQKTKTNYTMLDWRHAHSLFTVDVFIAKFLRFHPLHTMDPDEADVFIIPMMAHVYNCAGIMHYMTEILSWVVAHPYYKTYDNHDHFLFWWRWGMHYNSVIRFWKRVNQWIPNVNIISFDFLELMGRNEWQDFTLALKPRFFSVQNHIVVPYPEFSPLFNDSRIFDLHRNRSNFFFFTGTSTIGGIRRWIKRSCDSHPNDCVYDEFARNVIHTKRLEVPQKYPTMMMNSVFCGHAAGDSLSSRRPTSAILAGCIPVLICDLCLYAWENLINYNSFAVFVAEQDVMDGKLFEILRSIPENRIRRLRENGEKVRKRFVYNTNGPPSPGDALDTLVEELSIRGSLLRQYRRWFVSNQNLSSDPRDYPVEPRAVKKYLKQGVSSQKEEKDFNYLS